MTKREILLSICEFPGWSPPDLPSSSESTALGELVTEGWIVNRLDGFEASPHALTEYPDFGDQPDIADPDWKLSEPEPVAPAQWAEDLTLHHPLVVGNGQQVSSPIEVSFGSTSSGNTLKGGITLEMAGVDARERVEVEVTLRVRKAPTNGGG